MANDIDLKSVPKLGFGLMRLPMIGGQVDVEQMKKMTDRFLESGFKYIDTAYGYIGGKSEEAAKLAIFDRHARDEFLFATKMPVWEADTPADMERMLQTSLKRTGAEYFDFYLLHNVSHNGGRLKRYDEFNAWDFLESVKARGLARKIGFSFHDTADVLDRLLTEHPFVDFVQLQINYADWESASVQAKLNHEVARKHGKYITIMEPIKGGSLASPPPTVAKIFTDARPDKPLAWWALRFAASLDGVITALSGMSTLDQMVENTEFMRDFTPVTSDELKIYERAVAELNSIPIVPCTGCRYCVAECPNHFEINDFIATLNQYTVYQSIENTRGHYKWVAGSNGDPSGCLHCGACEAVCPQKLPIIETLERCVKTFG